MFPPARVYSRFPAQDQFALLTDFIVAICMGEASREKLVQYETEVTAARTKTSGGKPRSLEAMFGTMLGRASATAAILGPDGTLKPGDLDAVAPGRFQVLDVDRDVSIKAFAEENGLKFEPGRGFYSFSKPEKIAETKEIVLVANNTGDMFTGDKARTLLLGDAPAGSRTAGSRIAPVRLDHYTVFVQSTSYNRKLKAGTKFLYEVTK